MWWVYVGDGGAFVFDVGHPRVDPETGAYLGPHHKDLGAPHDTWMGEFSAEREARAHAESLVPSADDDY